jgi:hypothetical protein
MSTDSPQDVTSTEAEPETTDELTEEDLDNVAGATDNAAISDSISHYGKPPTPA